RRRHTRSKRDWSSDVCSSDLPLVVEAEQLLVGDQQIAAASLGLQLLELLDQGAVVAEEVVAGAPVPLDQRVLEEDLARRLRVDRSEERRVGKGTRWRGGAE